MSKQLLDRIEGGYALLIEHGPKGDFVFVGSESKDGESRVIPFDGGSPRTVTRAVGGMMHILPAPGRPGRYVAAMGMYAPFIGQGAGIYLLRSGKTPVDEWVVEKLFDMPFAHRIGFRQIDGKELLFVATVSEHKANPDDWSKPGALYVTDLAAALEGGSPALHCVTNELFRNHGMWAGELDGADSLLISGAEGVFNVVADAAASSGFRLEPLIANEVSEMVVADLDGDGVDEMVTLEPFHGNRLRVYKRRDGTGGSWESIWETSDLSFAHGLNVVPCGARTLVVLGSRRVGMELLAYDFGDFSQSPHRIVVDEGVGPTQVEPWSDGHDGSARFISCNQGAGEVSLYTLSEQEVAQ